MFNEFRYDYILIWGNGLAYKNEIISEIRNNQDFEIIKICNYKPKKISELVKAVYSYDYAPFWHLKNKTQYLLSTKPEVCFIFFKNQNPDEDYLGEAEFRHIESLTLKKFKEKLRDTFNERNEDRRSENHVIHATDNQEQADYILRYLGFDSGTDHFKKLPNHVIKAPYHISEFSEFIIKEVDIDSIYCNILSSEKNGVYKKRVPITKSPHYKSLVDDEGIYKSYIEEFKGEYLCDNHYLEKFKKLSSELTYLKASDNINDYILVEPLNSDSYVIIDGLHRASILKYKDEKKVIVGVIIR